jgi:2,3-bisphosphoglycerate-dependent phosphoglycerate mutase
VDLSERGFAEAHRAGHLLKTEGISDDAIVELNIPTGVPLVYELDANLTPMTHYYLGDPGEIRKAEQAVAKQGTAQ